MKKVLLLITVLSLLLLGVTTVWADISGAVEHDTFIDSSANNYNGSNLVATSTTAACTPFNTILLKKDVSNPADPAPALDYARLRMRVATSITPASNVTLTLFEVTSGDNWTQNSVNGTSGITIGGTALSTLTLNGGSTYLAGQLLSFPSTPAFAAFVNSQIPANGGDGQASFAIRITSCAATTSVQFMDIESGFAPSFDFRQNGPTAVNLVATESMSNNIWAGILLLLLLVATATFGIWRNRTAQKI